MLLTASYKPERPFVVVVAVSRWHVFLSDMCFPMQTPQGMCGRSGNQTSLFDFSRQCAILCVRKEHVTGEQMALNRRHWLCVLYLRNTTDATLGFQGFLAVGSRARNLWDPGFWLGVRRTKCTHIPSKNTAATVYVRGNTYHRGNTNTVPAEVGRLFAIQTGRPLIPALIFLLQIEGAG